MQQGPKKQQILQNIKVIETNITFRYTAAICKKERQQPGIHLME